MLTQLTYSLLCLFVVVCLQREVHGLHGEGDVCHGPGGLFTELLCHKTSINGLRGKTHTNECGGGYGWVKVYPGRRECGRDTAEIPTSVDALGDRGRNN